MLTLANPPGERRGSGQKWPRGNRALPSPAHCPSADSALGPSTGTVWFRGLSWVGAYGREVKLPLHATPALSSREAVHTAASASEGWRPESETRVSRKLGWRSQRLRASCPSCFPLKATLGAVHLQRPLSPWGLYFYICSLSCCSGDRDLSNCWILFIFFCHSLFFKYYISEMSGLTCLS